MLFIDGKFNWAVLNKKNAKSAIVIREFEKYRSQLAFCIERIVPK
jgi:hypothetical protein